MPLTAALDKGTLAIHVRLIRAATANISNVDTDYTIIHKPLSGAWQAAVPSAVANGDPADSPTSPGVAVPAVNNLSTSGALDTITADLYFFDTPGEYAVRNNGLSTGGAEEDNAFMVDFWDAHEGTTTTPCADCTGT